MQVAGEGVQEAQSSAHCNGSKLFAEAAAQSANAPHPSPHPPRFLKCLYFNTPRPKNHLILPGAGAGALEQTVNDLHKVSDLHSMENLHVVNS